MSFPAFSNTRPAMSRRGYRLSLAIVVLLALAALGIYLFEAARQVNGFGFPLDDSWIHLQIARNLATGHGWAFNPGEPTGAATAPLWIAMIAPLFYLGGDVTVWIKLLGSLLYLASVVLIVDVAALATGDRRVGLVAGLLAALQPAFIWAAVSGMETALYLLLFLLCLRSLFLIERRGRTSAYASTAWLTLAGLARPELWACLPVLWGYLFWRRRELAVGRWFVHAGIALAGIGGFALFNTILWGDPVPATLVAKRAHLRGFGQDTGLGGLRALAGRVTYNIDQLLRSQNAVLLACMAVGILVARQRRDSTVQRFALLAGVVGVGLVVISFVDVGDVSFQTYRRADHLLACMNVLVAAGYVATYQLVRYPAQEPPERHDPRSWLGMDRRRVWLVLFAGTSLAALLVQVLAVRSWGDIYANDVRSINQGDVAAGRWLATHTPADALIAANDVGAIAYFGERRILDMIGLASPEALAVLRRTPATSQERDDQMKALLFEQQVDYVAIFPAWFPSLAMDPRLDEVQRFTVENPTALAGDEVVIYRVAR